MDNENNQPPDLARTFGERAEDHRIPTFKTHALHTRGNEIKLRLYTEGTTRGQGSIHEVTIEHENGHGVIVKFSQANTFAELNEGAALKNLEDFEKDYLARGARKISGWKNFEIIENCLSKNSTVNNAFHNAMHYNAFREWRAEQLLRAAYRQEKPQQNVPVPKKRP